LGRCFFRARAPSFEQQVGADLQGGKVGMKAVINEQWQAAPTMSLMEEERKAHGADKKKCH